MRAWLLFDTQLLVAPSKERAALADMLSTIACEILKGEHRLTNSIEIVVPAPPGVDDNGRVLHRRYVDRLRARNFHHPRTCPGVPQGLGGAWGGIRCNACHPDVLDWDDSLISEKTRDQWRADARALLDAQP